MKVTGKGKGGRNQEIALAAALGIQGLRDTVVFSWALTAPMAPQTRPGILRRGQRGQDGPGHPGRKLAGGQQRHPALAACDGLIMTGPTGTNVNDLTVLLIKR